MLASDSACSGDAPGCVPWPVRTHLRPVLLVFAAALGIVYLMDLDARLADLIFVLEGGSWSLRTQPLLELVLHRSGRALVVLLALAMLAALLLSFPMARLRPARRPLVYLLISMGAAAGLVGLLKSVSPQHCPWDLARYGGHFASETFWNALASSGHCFPAGHASAGYCLFGLYFLACRRAPQLRRCALAVPILLGLTFGVTQQLRGAHFLSHDLWSAMLCWVAAWATARSILGAPQPGARRAAEPAEGVEPVQACTSSR